MISKSWTEIAPPQPRSGAESPAGRGGGQREENG